MKSHPNRTNRSIIVKFIACIFISLLLLVVCGCEDKEKKIREGMRAYLENRYGIEFVIDKLYINGDGGAARYEAKAHPKGQPKIQFVISDKENMEKSGPVEYRDSYLTTKWSYQGKLAAEKKIKEVYGPNTDFVVEYIFRGGWYKHKDMDYSQVMEQIRNAGARDDLEYVVFVDGSKFSIEEEALKAYKILKAFIIDYGFERAWFQVTYIDKADMKDYLSNPKAYEDQASRNYHIQTGFRPQYPLPTPKKILGRFMFAPISDSPIYHKINSGRDIIKYSKYQNKETLQ